MGETTGISWCDHTWNPWQGCAKVSPGCDNCYMFRDKARYGQDPSVVVRSKPHTFNAPLRWNREAKAAGVVRRVFVASWADFFGQESDAWRDDAWAIIRQCDSLIFQVLTKRHGRIATHLPSDWGNGWPNVWLGVSGEDQEWTDRRIAELSKVPAVVRWLSLEPQIADVSIVAWLTSGVISWVVQGGESGGPEARPFDVRWARDMRDACERAGVAYFLKQWGARPFDGAEGSRCDGEPHAWAWLKLIDRAGADPSEWPEPLRVRQFPDTTKGGAT